MKKQKKKKKNKHLDNFSTEDFNKTKKMFYKLVDFFSLFLYN